MYTKNLEIHMVHTDVNLTIRVIISKVCVCIYIYSHHDPTISITSSK